VYNIETYELVVEKAGLHSMGINDFSFMENEQIVTCSSDRTVKVWSLKVEDKAIDEVRKLGLSEEDDKGLKDNVEKQQLGCAVDAQNNILSV
jgi:WD40 repeat protein